MNIMTQSKLLALSIAFCVTTFLPLPAHADKAVRALITNWGGDSIAVVDPVEGTIIADIKTGLKPHGVDIAPDGKTIYVSNEGDGTLSFIDPAKNEVTATIPVGSAPN